MYLFQLIVQPYSLDTQKHIKSSNEHYDVEYLAVLKATADLDNQHL